MLDSMPRSIWLIGFTAVVYLLQLWPFQGRYSDPYGSPLDRFATINAGFIGLGVEALAGRINKIWLIAPLFWFAGYEYIAWKSHRAVEPLQNEILAFNDQKWDRFRPGHAISCRRKTTDSGIVRKLLRKL